MKKLPPPQIHHREVYTTCSQGILQQDLKNRVDQSLPGYEAHARDYETKGANGNLYQIQPVVVAPGVDPVVLGNLSKSELINLYEYYFLRKHPARDIYDKILLSANERCPFCGGIGRPRTLDHYLPKSSFPQFSIHPLNLCPCCRDCNSEGKASTFATRPEDQIIHPYFDSPHFFEDQWVFANIIEDDPCVVDFYLNPPRHWNDTDRARVRKHFEVFDIKVRFSIQAAEELSDVIDGRRGHLREFTQVMFAEDLIQKSLAPSLFANHWKRVTYQALSQSDWFCANVF